MADTAIADCSRKFREVQEKVREFFDKVNEVLSWVPGAFASLIEPIKRGMATISEKFVEFENQLSKLFEQPGSPSELDRMSQEWTNAVSNPIGDIAGNVALHKLHANVEWQGRAAEAYKALVPAQTAALNGVKALATQMSDALHNLSDALETFWLAIYVAIGVFVVGAVAAIAQCFTVVDIPGGIATILGAVGVSAGLVATEINSVHSAYVQTEAQQRSLQQKIHDVGKTWARSDQDLSDGSVSDGDSSDWRINQ